MGIKNQTIIQSAQMKRGLSNKYDLTWNKKGIINMKCNSLPLTGLKLAFQFLFNLANIVFSTVTIAASACCQYFSVSALLELLFVSLKMARKKEEENIFANIQFLGLAFMKGQL